MWGKYLVKFHVSKHLICNQALRRVPFDRFGQYNFTICVLHSAMNYSITFNIQYIYNNCNTVIMHQFQRPQELRYNILQIYIYR